MYVYIYVYIYIYIYVLYSENEDAGRYKFLCTELGCKALAWSRKTRGSMYPTEDPKAGNRKKMVGIC